MQQDSNALKAEIQQKKLDQQEQIKKKAEIDKRVSEIQGRLDVVDATTQEEITQKENLSNAVSGVQTDLSNLAQEVVDTSNTASSTLIENDSAVVEEKS
ncbi:MAG: hypothetical protein LBO09_01220 [Candidatus Peribacteria bacterium]|nr:hypothetical protein [Candidatus Peribacteria bacterium]